MSRSWNAFCVVGELGAWVLAWSISFDSALCGNHWRVGLDEGGIIGICWSITSRESLVVDVLRLWITAPRIAMNWDWSSVVRRVTWTAQLPPQHWRSDWNCAVPLWQ